MNPRLELQPTAPAGTLPAAVCIARSHALHGRAAHAATLLAPLLRSRDPASAPPDPDLVEASTLYLRIGLHAGLDLPGLPSRPWAQYAYDAARLLHGPVHDRTLTAGQALAVTLTNERDHHAALSVRRALLDGHTRRGDRAAAWRARLELGCTLHAAGRCDDGIREARRACYAWDLRHGIDGAGAIMLITVSALLRACRRTAETDRLLGQARDAIRLMLLRRDPAERRRVVTRMLTTQPAALDEHVDVCIHRANDGPDRGPNRIYVTDVLGTTRLHRSRRPSAARSAPDIA